MAKKLRIIVENIRTASDEPDEAVLREAERRARSAGIECSADVFRLRKRSVDARHKNRIAFVSSAFAEVPCAGFIPDPAKLSKLAIRVSESPEITFETGSERAKHRPVVVGFGPAGIFAAIALAEHGLAPVIFERGYDIDRRTADVDRFICTGELDPNSNVQFGAGGAGTFSDGKLTCRIGDPRCDYVIDKLHTLGAPEDVKWKAKPHVGTDRLREVIKNAESYLRDLGAEIRFGTKVTEIGDGYVKANSEKIPACAVVIATGHSARDLYFNLLSDGFDIAAKPFSVGIRIEHLQSDIDEALYGDADLWRRLGHGEYSLSHRVGERGVYSFCMCPGGTVMASASEDGGIVTNGMSLHARDGRNANAALAVSVLPTDFGGSPTGAIEFQRSIEKRAFALSGSYAAPAQTVGDFLRGAPSKSISGRVNPTYMNGNVLHCDISDVLPDFVTDMLRCGIRSFGKKIRGFDSDDAVLTAPETRTSAPVRILRGENMTAIGKSNVYPCGEGAGYAGGIVSAAVDGIRVAQAILARFAPFDD